ncbi:MAG: hypothetical protein AAGG01_08965, partial [Planctomycetota bacterium]
ALSLDNVTLTVTHLPPGVTTMFIVGDAPGDTVLGGSSVGRLCVSGTLGRFRQPGQIQQADSSGRSMLDVQPSRLPGPTGVQTAVYGSSFYFQGWYRDQASGNATSNLTQGVEVTFF